MKYTTAFMKGQLLSKKEKEKIAPGATRQFNVKMHKSSRRCGSHRDKSSLQAPRLQPD